MGIPILSLFVTLAEVASLFILLPMLFFKKSRGLAGKGYIVCSYILGINLWVISAINLWMNARLWFWIGIFLLGIGVVPVSIVYDSFHGWWSDVLTLLGDILVIWILRVLGAWAKAKDTLRKLEILEATEREYWLAQEQQGS
jgi:hypothetical protein